MNRIGVGLLLSRHIVTNAATQAGPNISEQEYNMVHGIWRRQPTQEDSVVQGFLHMIFAICTKYVSPAHLSVGFLSEVMSVDMRKSWFAGTFQSNSHSIVLQARQCASSAFEEIYVIQSFKSLNACVFVASKASQNVEVIFKLQQREYRTNFKRI
nr:hypothetical protein Iba_chr04dCG15960 [Ipomoea batatas]